MWKCCDETQQKLQNNFIGLARQLPSLRAQPIWKFGQYRHMHQAQELILTSTIDLDRFLKFQDHLNDGLNITHALCEVYKTQDCMYECVCVCQQLVCWLTKVAASDIAVTDEVTATDDVQTAMALVRKVCIRAEFRPVAYLRGRRPCCDASSRLLQILLKSA